MRTRMIVPAFALLLLAVLVAAISMIPLSSAISQAAGSRDDEFRSLLNASQLSALRQLRIASADDVEIVWNPETNTPSFMSGRIPLTAIAIANATSPAVLARAFLEQYAALFGITDPASELAVVAEYTDALGMHHVTFQQMYQGVEVYNSLVKTHLSADRRAIAAVSNRFAPNIRLTTSIPRVTAEQAVAAARKAMPSGTLQSAPRLVVYYREDAAAQLAWLVDVLDEASFARNIYVVDAIDIGFIDVRNGVYTDRDRKTYDARNSRVLPGNLMRTEGQEPVGDRDVDNAHNFAGDAYDYFWQTFRRDSYDGAGATITSTVNYKLSSPNAFWNGQQFVYGRYMATKDIVAHEFTHAVTQFSANLEYRWQSGALNESFSDIFAAMVDRDDWLIGEDLPQFILDLLNTQEAIRDLSNPPRFRQPDHTKDWLKTCADEEGVHTNSGIVNKAYYNIATAIGKEKAEQVFYRALTVYLQPRSSFSEARAAVLQSATDLWPDGSEHSAIAAGFDMVGLSSNWNPPRNNCSCAATVALSDPNIFADRLLALDTAATLYRLRDQFLAPTATGDRYRQLYDQHTGRISQLLLLNTDLRNAFGSILTEVTPALNHLMDDQGDRDVVTQDLVNEVLAFLDDLAANDRASGDGELAATIEREKARIDWNRLVGMTYDEAWEYIQAPFSTYVPITLK